MAKAKLTAAQIKEAEPYVTSAMASKIASVGAAKGSLKFRRDRNARDKTTRRALEGFLKDGGKFGDWESFLTWLIEHADEMIAFISKLIALFTKT